MRVSPKMVDELIANDGEVITFYGTGPVNNVGVLRLALELKAARDCIRAIKRLNKGCIVDPQVRQRLIDAINTYETGGSR